MRMNRDGDVLAPSFVLITLSGFCFIYNINFYPRFFLLPDLPFLITSPVLVILILVFLISFNLLNLINKKKYIMIYNEFKNEDKRKKIKGNIIIFIIFFMNNLLVIASGFLMWMKNVGKL